MQVGDAKDVARRWVREEAPGLPGFTGAFFHGSVNDLPDGAELSDTVDLDIMVVLDGPEPAQKPGKFRYQSVLLEVSTVSAGQIATPEQVLGQYQIAPSFRVPSVIADPDGWLTPLQAAVAREFAARPWVTRRCEHARDNSLRFLDSLKESAPFPEQVPSWLFGAGVTTHILLVAGLRNPTVRRRYVAARELLAQYGRSDFYPPLLSLLGGDDMTPERAGYHMDALERAFDTAKAMLKTPYPFAADLSATGRVVAIDGSREMIAGGDHREAIFWMAATFSRCQWVLAHDGTEAQQAQHGDDYRALLGDLGILSQDDLLARADAVREFLPRVWSVAEEIMAANPAIFGGGGATT